MLEYVEYTIQKKSPNATIINLVFKDPSKHEKDRENLENFLKEVSSLDSKIIEAHVTCGSPCELHLTVRCPERKWFKMSKTQKTKYIIKQSHILQDMYNQEFKE
jgi:hypothetical protein